MVRELFDTRACTGTVWRSITQRDTEHECRPTCRYNINSIVAATLCTSNVAGYEADGQQSRQDTRPTGHEADRHEADRTRSRQTRQTSVNTHFIGTRFICERKTDNNIYSAFFDNKCYPTYSKVASNIKQHVELCIKHAHYILIPCSILDYLHMGMG